MEMLRAAAGAGGDVDEGKRQRGLMRLREGMRRWKADFAKTQALARLKLALASLVSLARPLGRLVELEPGLKKELDRELEALSERERRPTMLAEEQQPVELEALTELELQLKADRGRERKALEELRRREPALAARKRRLKTLAEVRRPMELGALDLVELELKRELDHELRWELATIAASKRRLEELSERKQQLEVLALADWEPHLKRERELKAIGVALEAAAEGKRRLKALAERGRRVEELMQVSRKLEALAEARRASRAVADRRRGQLAALAGHRQPLAALLEVKRVLAALAEARRRLEGEERLEMALAMSVLAAVNAELTALGGLQQQLDGLARPRRPLQPLGQQQLEGEAAAECRRARRALTEAKQALEGPTQIDLWGKK